jgi:DNA polymerase-3 subunit delta
MPEAPPKIKVTPLTVVVSDEQLLADREVARLAAAVQQADPSAEIRDVSPASVDSALLAELGSPSLFGEQRLVVLRDTQELGKDIATEVAQFLSLADESFAIVLVHSGAAKNKALLEAAAAAGAARLERLAPKKYSERIAFVRSEVAAAGGRLTEDGARALLDAVGNDLRDLASACSQLAADSVQGPIDEAVVSRYYRGRAEANGFAVADHALEGRLAEALEQLRWALAVGVEPVLINSALAQGVRSIARVASAPRGLREADLARELKMPSWKIDRVRQQMRGWTPDGIAVALRALAEADADIKGRGADPAYALEQAVMALVAARSNRR